VKLPDPVPGLVIRFDYVWHGNHSEKERPCAIVLAQTKQNRVAVVPITHAYPEVGEEAESLQIPPDICKHMGLDEEVNYIRLSEINLFEWPSSRIRPLPNDNTRCDYGMIPKDFFDEMRKHLAAARAAERLKVVKPDAT